MPWTRGQTASHKHGQLPGIPEGLVDSSGVWPICRQRRKVLDSFKQILVFFQGQITLYPVELRETDPLQIHTLNLISLSTTQLWILLQSHLSVPMDIVLPLSSSVITPAVPSHTSIPIDSSPLCLLHNALHNLPISPAVHLPAAQFPSVYLILFLSPL